MVGIQVVRTLLLGNSNKDAKRLLVVVRRKIVWLKLQNINLPATQKYISTASASYGLLTTVNTTPFKGSMCLITMKRFECFILQSICKESSDVKQRHERDRGVPFCLCGNFKWRQIKCATRSCTRSMSSSKRCAEMRRGVGLTEDWGVGGGYQCELRLFDAVIAAGRGSFTLDWRSIAGGGGRGRCHRLSLVLARRAEGAHCQSSCYRKSPHSSYSGASVLRWRTPSHTACSGWRLCPSTKLDPPEELCWLL